MAKYYEFIMELNYRRFMQTGDFMPALSLTSVLELKCAVPLVIRHHALQVVITQMCWLQKKLL